MAPNKSRKHYQIIAWILLLVGMVMAVDGLLQIMSGNTSRTGEASIGGVLMILSGLFFAAARKKAEPIAAVEEEEEEG